MQAKPNFKNKSSNARQFGFTVAAFLFLLCAVHFHKNHGHPRIEIVAALSFALLALQAPHFLQKPAALWLKFGEILHGIMSPIVMGVLYFFIFTPYAILLRSLRGENVLKHLIDKEAKSYWETDQLATISKENLKKQH